MAQELELIVELLREMKRANSSNIEGFDRLLNGISKKLEMMEEKNSSTTLIKAYLEELTKNVDEKYSTTLLKFGDIENALKSIFSEQQEQVKNKNMQELFDIFSKNMNGFYSEAKQQKAILAGIENRLSDLSNNKSDKEDIMRTINLLRNDFENLNHAYKSIIDDVNSNLKAILSNLIKMDQSNINAEMKEQLDIMYKAANDIVNYLKSIDEKDTKMEALLSNVVTNESLKTTQGVIDSIIEKTEIISEKIKNLSDKTDIEGLQAAAVIMNNKLDDSITKEEFSKINLKTESLLTIADEVKKNLAEVTKDVENLPNTKFLEGSLQNLFKRFDNLCDDLDKSNVKGDVYDINTKIETLKDELLTIRNIVSDLNEVLTEKVLTAIDNVSFENESYDIKTHISKMLAQLPQKEDIERILNDSDNNNTVINNLIERTDTIFDRLDNLPTHKDIETLNNNQLGLIENLQAVSTKDDIDNISAKTDEIEEMIDKLNFDNEFEHIYDKTSSIEKWLIDSKIKETSQEINDKLENKSEQKDILELLSITKKITDELEELSQNADPKKVNRTVADVYQMIDELKNDFINTTEMHNDSVVVQLAEIQKSISGIISGEEFVKFIEDLKDFTRDILKNSDSLFSNIEEAKQQQQEILAKLENLDFSKFTTNLSEDIVSFTGELKQTLEASQAAMSEKFDTLDSKIISISDYLNNGVRINDEELKTFICDIRELLQNKKSNMDGIELEAKHISEEIQKYLENMKNILDTSNNGLSDEVKTLLNKLENNLIQYKTANEDQFGKIIDRLDAYQNLSEDISVPITAISESMEELSGIKEQIAQLGESFSSLSIYSDSPSKAEVPSFISEKLNELAENLGELSACVENGIQQGFAYNAELVEEKTSIILGFIKELRHASTEDIDLYERLTVTDNKLMDLQQELELIDTDVINNLTERTGTLIEELEPIKEMVKNLPSAGSNSDGSSANILSSLEELHCLVQKDLENNSQYSKNSFDKLEESYTKISDRLTSTENKLRDFILGDVDSVIIKIDSLKSELEESLNRIAPPDAGQMAEFRKFIVEINTFKKEQKELLDNAVKNIKTSITEKMDNQHDEIKSLITVAANNEEIIHAIEELKNSFKQRISEFSENQQKHSSDEFAENQYESVFNDNNEKVIEDIKQDFNKFSALINDLSGENPEIEEVLNTIREKIDTITVRSKISSGANSVVDINRDNIEEETNLQDECNNSGGDKILIGANNFDFIKAFDLLKQDIANLHSDIEKIVPQHGDQTEGNFSESLSSIPKVGSDNLILKLNNKIEDLPKKINNDWLEQIKGYLAGGEIKEMLEDISGKIDILTLTDSSGWIEDIKKTIEQLNTGEISSSDDNNEIQKMLSLINDKIDILASSEDFAAPDSGKGNNNSATEIKETLDLLDKKIDILASSANNDEFADLQESIVSIEEKIDTLTPYTGDSELKDLQNSLVNLGNKIDIIAASDNSDDFADLQESLTGLESKIDSIKNEEQTENFEDIKDRLENLNQKIDIIAASDYSDNLEDIMDNVYSIGDKIASIDIKPVEDNVKMLSESDAKITSMLETLNHKIDEVFSKENTNPRKEFEDIKYLISAQTDYIKNLENNGKTDAFKKCLKELTQEVNNLHLNSDPGSEQIQKSLKEMKESIMSAVVTIFNQISFIEESEDIKDFVEERTDEINQNLEEVTKQLKQITSSNDETDYNYSMQDIESDLAKLRIALNELHNNELESRSSELSNISDNVNRITSTIEELQNSMTQDEIKDIKFEISDLKEQTQKILDSSGESYNAINNGLEDFSKSITSHLADKVDRVTRMLEKSSNSDKVMRQALIYMGEWIDSASESMNKISTNSYEIIDVKKTIEDLKQEIPEQTSILNSIEEKFDEQQDRLSYFEKQITKLGNLEEKFEQQEERIDRLEMTIEKILSAVEDIDDSKVSKKIDKLDKQLAKLSINIEKLAAYVD